MEFKVVLVDLLTKIHVQLNHLQQAKPIDNEGNLLQVEEVLVYLHISRRTYYRLVQKGELIPRIIGGRHYYYLSDLYNALKQSKNKGRL